MGACFHNVRMPVASIQVDFQSTDYKHIRKKYIVDSHVLGFGNFGKVFLASHANNPEFKVAIKTIQKSQVKDSLELIKQEINILSHLDHPNIIKYYETFESPQYIYLVMELCSGTELIDYITE